MKTCRRATILDDEYGTICPDCAGPKTEQALRCRDCYNANQIAPDHWQQRTCSCGRPKGRTSPRCRHCYIADYQPSEGTGRPQSLDHPWRRAERARVTESAA